MSDIKLCEWDSEKIGKRVGSIRVDNEKQLQESIRYSPVSYDIIYAFCSERITVPRGYFGHELGGFVQYRLSLDAAEYTGWSSSQKGSKASVDICTDISRDIEDLALLSGEHSRFKHDPNMPPGFFLNLYKEWINSLEKDQRKELLIARTSNDSADSSIEGIILTRHEERLSRIELLAVNKASRGKGVGSALVKSCICRSLQKRSDHILVNTQIRNVQACKLYERMGFKEVERKLIYHLHKSPHDG